jgi:predicted unusual protein kinase regulating ubiquinone biosynthesis (AarF/ABC1/UbiB family)
VRKELNFVHEAENLVVLKEAMARLGSDAVIPELVPRYTTTRVLVMHYCPGFKVSAHLTIACISYFRL